MCEQEGSKHRLGRYTPFRVSEMSVSGMLEILIQIEHDTSLHKKYDWPAFVIYVLLVLLDIFQYVVIFWRCQGNPALTIFTFLNVTWWFHTATHQSLTRTDCNHDHKQRVQLYWAKIHQARSQKE